MHARAVGPWQEERSRPRATVECRGGGGKLMEERNQAQLCGHTLRLTGMGNRVYKSPH